MNAHVDGVGRRPSRLQDLSPDDLAFQTVEAVLAQLDVLAAQFFPPVRMSDLRGLTRRDREGDREQRKRYALATPLGQAVRSLTRFAQTGVGDSLAILCAMESVWQTACISPLEQGGYTNLDQRMIELRDHPLSVVLLAALGRCRLDFGADVPVRELAALADTDEEEVRRELDATRAVDAAAASRWLERRRLPS